MDDIEFTELQMDAIIELINMGIGRAADALAKMMSEEVCLSVPNVTFVNHIGLGNHLRSIDIERPSVIKQHFNGDFSGNALLVFPEVSGELLVKKMLGEMMSAEQIIEVEEEALKEAGNIILNACFGQLAELLATNLDSDIPAYKKDTIDDILEFSEASEMENSTSQVMLLQVDFSLSESEMKGFVLFVMDVGSMAVFKQKVNAYLKKLFN